LMLPMDVQPLLLGLPWPSWLLGIAGGLLLADAVVRAG